AALLEADSGERLRSVHQGDLLRATLQRGNLPKMDMDRTERAGSQRKGTAVKGGSPAGRLDLRRKTRQRQGSAPQPGCADREKRVRSELAAPGRREPPRRRPAPRLQGPLR